MAQGAKPCKNYFLKALILRYQVKRVGGKGVGSDALPGTGLYERSLSVGGGALAKRKDRASNKKGQTRSARLVVGYKKRKMRWNRI